MSQIQIIILVISGLLLLYSIVYWLTAAFYKAQSDYRSSHSHNVSDYNVNLPSGVNELVDEIRYFIHEEILRRKK